MLKIEKLPARIYIGNEGEENAVQVRFDVSAWDTLYPDAVYSITYVRPGETIVYPEVPSHVVHADGVLTWAPSESVLDISDYGTVVINCTEDDVKKKSVMTMFFVARSHPSSGAAPDPIADWIDDANAVMGQIASYAESASTSASEASGYADQAGQVLSSVDTLHDETKIFRDDAEDFAQAAHSSEQTASEKAGQAESAMGAAIAAADEAGRYYASLIGTELEVDVINGTLNLYSAGDYSPIDIELNDRSLEVWGA